MEDQTDTLISDLGLDEDLTPTIHEDGETVQLMIKMANKHLSKSGGTSIHLVFSDMEEPDVYEDIDHYLSLPSPDDDVKVSKRKRRNIKFFYEAFGIDTSEGINLNAIQGLTGAAILGIDEYLGVQKNVIKKFVEEQ